MLQFITTVIAISQLREWNSRPPDGTQAPQGEGDVIKMKTKLVGRYIVTDPEICHGKPTFRGTRILVADVLDQVADGLAWETIIEE